MKRILVTTALLACLAALTPSATPASSTMLKGIFDDAATLGTPDESFPVLKTLRVKIVRVTLYWGGSGGVAHRGRPGHATDPADPAYDWGAFDKVVKDAADNDIKVLFTIFATPTWANGGKGVNRAPKLMRDLRNFSYAAAKRYSGTFTPDDGDPNTVDTALPAVRYWLAWNEPTNPIFLQPQYVRVGTGKKRHWVAQSPRTYAAMCTAVYTGVHSTMLRSEKVGCGVTGPRGNNNPLSSRPSIGPIPFVKGLKAAGLQRFDAYAHNPYYGKPSETPASIPTTNRGKRGRIAPPVVLGNIGDLIKQVDRAWGRKRIWITEYGYQTKPPDRLFGVTWAKQATYVRQAFAIARKNPRIDMMIWFLLRDEQRASGWQSGLMTAAGKHKPAFNAFRAVR